MRGGIKSLIWAKKIEVFMSQSIGGKIRNIMVGVLIGLLVLAFAVWGVNDVFTPSDKNAVISVGDTDVTTEQFDQAFRREMSRIAEERGEGLSNEQAYAQGLHRQILQRMVTDAVISEDADDLGIGVNRRDARKYIESFPAFRNELTGQFSEDKLNSILADNRITRAQFEADTLRDMRRQQTVPAIVGGIEAPTEYAKRYFDFVSEQRKATILTLNEAALDPIENPDDDTLKAYIDTNGASFMAPEYRQVLMIRLEPFDLFDDLEVTEEEIRESFEYRVDLGELGSPEKRDITTLSAPTEEQAQSAATRMAGGESPELVAAGLGLSSPDVFTGILKDGLVDAEASKAAFEIAEGEAKAVLGSLGSWVAVYVPSITPAIIPDYEAGKAELRENLLKEKAQDQLYDITGQIEDAMTEGQTLEEISESLDVTLLEYDYIDRTGTTRDDITLSGFDRIPGIASDDTILREIFTSDMGFETDLFETENGGYAAIRVEDIIDTTMRPFDEIKEQALAFWQAEQKTEALTAKAVELQKQVREGKTLRQLAAELGAGADLREMGLTRVNPPRDIGQRVAAELLDAEAGDLVRGVGAVPLTHHIARLDTVTSNQDVLAGQFLDVIQERRSAELSADIQNAYQQAVLRDNPLQEYPAKVRSALGLDAAEEAP